MTITNPTADLKNYSVAITTHGTSTSGLVSVGRTSTGQLYVVQQSTSSSNWNPVSGGNANANDASGQTQTAAFAFPVSVSDILVILSHQDGNSSKINAPSSAAFGGVGVQ